MASPLSAQTPAGPNPGRRPFAVVGPDDGVPSGGVISLTQDLEGFIWMGTEHGLIRYNRGQCRQWSTADGLPSAFVGTMVPAPDGGLWLGTQGGLVRFKDGRFEPAQLGSEASRTPTNQMAMDRQGRLWVMNAQGMFRQKEGLEFAPLPWNIDENTGTLVAGRTSGAMYLALEHGLRAYHADGTIQYWGAAEGLRAGVPTLVVEDGAGRLWVGSARTLLLKEARDNRFRDQSSLLPASLSPNSTPFLDTDGSVWLPTQNGALHINGNQTERLDANGGLPFRWVRSIFRDREGTLWVLGPAVARLLGGGRVLNYTLSKGSTGEIVWAVIRDRKGKLLVGTDDGAATMEPDGLTRIPGTEGRRIKAMAVDRSGTLWMVSTIGPALWLRAGQSRAETMDFGELGSSLNSVKEDSQGQLWLGHSRQGLLRWDPKARKLLQEVGPKFIQTKSLGAFGIHEDAAGRLWVGTTAGLLVRDTNSNWRLYTDKDGLRPNTVRGLAFLPDGSAWVHYQEPQGLTRVRLEGERFTVVEHRTSNHGLRTDLVYGIQVDSRGQVWTSTDQGLNRLEPKLHIGSHEGMTSEDCSIHALLVEEGQIWIGTAGGLVGYNPLVGEREASPPIAHLILASFGGRAVEPPFAPIYTVPFHENTALFKVATPTYVDEQDLRFQVRMAGLGEDWRDVEGRVVRYPGLNGGRYRFEVRAAHGTGPFGPVTALDFVVHPPWWKTWWCFSLEILAGAALVFGFIRLRVAALAQSKIELESLVAQRTEELRSRNEELSAALTHVKQLSGLLPICASCKMIRDDQGSWTQLERYISQHSEADFTHGICPNCAKVLYPELGQK